MEIEEGHYTIKRLKKLPRKGNANWLYIIRSNKIENLYRWTIDGDYEKIQVGSGITSVEAGTNVTITGTGTELDPYIVNSNGTGSSNYTLSSIDINNQFSLLEDGVVKNTIDLTPYLDNTNLARLVSGTLEAGTGILTVTRDDATTFTIDLSDLIDGAGSTTSVEAGTNTTVTGTGTELDPYIISSPIEGDVFKVGTPVDDQVGVWTGNGTIEGDPNFTWDGQKLKVKVGVTPLTEAGASFSYGTTAAGIFAGIESKQTGIEGDAAYHLTGSGTSNSWTMSLLGSSRGNGFTISKNYDSTSASRALHIDKTTLVMTAPNITIAVLDAAVPKALVTKEWVEAKAIGQGYTVATLPAGTQGMRAYVTDATATTFYSIVAGGGANVVPVFYNGTNWVIA